MRVCFVRNHLNQKIVVCIDRLKRKAMQVELYTDNTVSLRYLSCEGCSIMYTNQHNIINNIETQIYSLFLLNYHACFCNYSAMFPIFFTRGDAIYNYKD